MYLYNIIAMKINTRQKYIAAVSGGPDSMAMLNKFRKCIALVCHVNYHKRPDSNHDQQIVAKFCKKYAIPMLIKNVFKDEYKKASEHNFQALARQIRYDFFVEAAESYQCYKLLVAHNLNDFVETAIMQQQRKSLNYFYGIKQISHYKNLTIYRPLINEFKTDLEKYCLKNKIDFAIDSTNKMSIYERNVIRKKLAKYSKARILSLYNKFQKRNKAKEKYANKVLKLYKAWEKTKFDIKTFKKLKFNIDLIYLFLSNHEITNRSKNKIQLIKKFILSNKSNITLRLQDKKLLLKKNGKIAIIKGEKHD